MRVEGERIEGGIVEESKLHLFTCPVYNRFPLLVSR